MTTQMSLQNEQATFLRNTLTGNAIFSVVSGLVLSFGASAITGLLGVGTPLLYVVMGISILLFGGAVYWVSTQTPLSQSAAITILVLDVVWVVASEVLLFTDWVTFTTAGWWAVAIVADIVAVFAILEYIGLRRLQQG